MTFEEVRRHLGVETQRQWSDLAIARTTPVLLGRFSVVTLLASGWHAEGSLGARGASWYAKGSPTFSDCIGLAREKIWRSRISDGSRMGAQSVQLPESLLSALIEGLSSAA